MRIALSIGAAGVALVGAAPIDTPATVGVCALQADPPAYNRKLIDVSGVVSHGGDRR